MAATADRHDLYERAVQDPDSEIDFIERVFKRLRGRPALRLREDFCGTALLSAEWVKGGAAREAIGVDLDRSTLAWALKRRVEPLGSAAARVTLLCDDVLRVSAPPADVVAALNFSYSLIRERRDLLDYFRRVRGGLVRDGLFVLDFHAGPRSQEEIEEETELEGFTYVWEQGPLNAISGRARRAIHFCFPDGSEIHNAFRYEFRVWTLPELRDLLDDAGFAAAHVYFEDFDEDGYPIGPPKKVRRVAHEDSWIGYLVAEPHAV